MVPAADYRELEEEREAVVADLADRKDEVARLTDAREVAEAGGIHLAVVAALATDDDDGFASLVSTARAAQFQLPFIVRKVVWQAFGSRDGAGYRPEFHEWDDIRREIDNARLRTDSESLVYLEEDDDGVMSCNHVARAGLAGSG
ncbi:MAG: hypothetical protein QOI20_2844 [Acidimicrobiaceae bacterium]|jgi:hypothetical protein|nr:hypothetical protein [Acidimicrobiaceae bacterium]